VTPTEDKQRLIAQVQTALGYKLLSRTWAKVEVLLGLSATGLGLFLGDWAVSRPAEVEWPFAVVALVLFVLGCYLALAGHRSHLYQSSNELTALLLEHLRRLEGKG
jgi:hypothetical protein